MENIKQGSLEIQVNKNGNIVEMFWVGKSDERDPSVFLNPYFNALIEEIKGLELVVDFRKLEYMNSSSVPPIIHFIKELDTNKIKTTIIYMQSLNWQAASFKALETISSVMSNVTVEGK